MPYPFLHGERLYLRALEETDADGPYGNWLNDAEVCRGNSHHVFPCSRDKTLAYIRTACERQDALVLAIILRDGDRHIGNIALQDIHPIYRSAEYAILLGERAEWGKGYAREASFLILDHGFKVLNLHRVHCGTFADNLSMQRLAGSLGMKEEGRRRQAAFKEGRWVDVIEYGLLASEFQAAPAAKSPAVPPSRPVSNA